MANFTNGIIFIGHHCPKCGLSFDSKRDSNTGHLPSSHPLWTGSGWGVMANKDGRAVVCMDYDPEEPLIIPSSFTFPITCCECGEDLYGKNGEPNPEFAIPLVKEYVDTLGFGESLLSITLEVEPTSDTAEEEPLHYWNRQLELPSVCPECGLSFEESWNHSVPGEITHENYPLNAGSRGGMVYEGLLVVPYGYEELDNDDNLMTGPFGYPISCSSCHTVLYDEEGKYTAYSPTGGLKPQLDTMIPTKPVEEQ